MPKKLLISIICALVLGGVYYTHSKQSLMFGSSTFQVVQGGTGASTLTGCLTGNGTSAITGSGVACGSGTSAFEIATTSTIAISNLSYFTKTGGRTTVDSVATTSVSCSGSTTCTSFTAIGSSPITISSSGGGGSGNVATSTNEVSGQIPIFSSNSATPATIAGDSNLTWSTSYGGSSPGRLFAGPVPAGGGVSGYERLVLSDNDGYASEESFVVGGNGGVVFHMAASNGTVQSPSAFSGGAGSVIGRLEFDKYTTGWSPIGDLTMFGDNNSLSLNSTYGIIDISAASGVGINTASPTKMLTVGESNAGTFSISTSTAGCASFSNIGELYSVGAPCGSATKVATSSTEVANYYPFWTSAGATPATLGGTSHILDTGTGVYIPDGFAPFWFGTFFQIGDQADRANPSQVFMASYTSASGWPLFEGNWLSNGNWAFGPTTNQSDYSVRIGSTNGQNQPWDADQSAVNIAVGNSFYGTKAGVNDSAASAYLSVVGNAQIGYSSGQAAPTNSLVVSSKVGVGTTTPYTTLDTAQASSTAGAVQSTPFARLVEMVINGVWYMVDSFDYYGHLITAGPTPTLSSCGSSPTISGNDRNMRIYEGTSAGTSCTVTFAYSYVTAPVCIVNQETGTAATLEASSTPSTVLISGAGVLSSDAFTIHCEGIR